MKPTFSFNITASKKNRWGSELWDQRGKIESATQEKIDFVSTCKSLIQQVSDVEIAYARNVCLVVGEQHFNYHVNTIFGFLVCIRVYGHILCEYVWMCGCVCVYVDCLIIAHPSYSNVLIFGYVMWWYDCDVDDVDIFDLF